MAIWDSEEQQDAFDKLFLWCRAMGPYTTITPAIHIAAPEMFPRPLAEASAGALGSEIPLAVPFCDDETLACRLKSADIEQPRLFLRGPIDPSFVVRSGYVEVRHWLCGFLGLMDYKWSQLYGVLPGDVWDSICLNSPETPEFTDADEERFAVAIRHRWLVPWDCWEDPISDGDRLAGGLIPSVRAELIAFQLLRDAVQPSGGPILVLFPDADESAPLLQAAGIVNRKYQSGTIDHRQAVVEMFSRLPVRRSKNRKRDALNFAAKRFSLSKMALGKLYLRAGLTHTHATLYESLRRSARRNANREKKGDQS